MISAAALGDLLVLEALALGCVCAGVPAAQTSIIARVALFLESEDLMGRTTGRVAVLSLAAVQRPSGPWARARFS